MFKGISQLFQYEARPSISSIVLVTRPQEVVLTEVFQLGKFPTKKQLKSPEAGTSNLQPRG